MCTPGRGCPHRDCPLRNNPTRPHPVYRRHRAGNPSVRPHIDPEIKRIALVNTFKDEAEESLRVARALGKRLWAVRLDTPTERRRVTPELVREIRSRLNQAGFAHVRIAVSGRIDPVHIALFRNRSAPVDAFGVGRAISSAPPIDFTADIKEIEGRPIAKAGRIPGITPNPNLQRIL